MSELVLSRKIDLNNQARSTELSQLEQNIYNTIGGPREFGKSIASSIAIGTTFALLSYTSIPVLTAIVPVGSIIFSVLSYKDAKKYAERHNLTVRETIKNIEFWKGVGASVGINTISAMVAGLLPASSVIALVAKIGISATSRVALNHAAQSLETSHLLRKDEKLRVSMSAKQAEYLLARRNAINELTKFGITDPDSLGVLDIETYQKLIELVGERNMACIAKAFPTNSLSYESLSNLDKTLLYRLLVHALVRKENIEVVRELNMANRLRSELVKGAAGYSFGVKASLALFSIFGATAGVLGYGQKVMASQDRGGGGPELEDVPKPKLEIREHKMLTKGVERHVVLITEEEQARGILLNRLGDGRNIGDQNIKTFSDGTLLISDDRGDLSKTYLAVHKEDGSYQFIGLLKWFRDIRIHNDGNEYRLAEFPRFSSLELDQPLHLKLVDGDGNGNEIFVKTSIEDLISGRFSQNRIQIDHAVAGSIQDGRLVLNLSESDGKAGGFKFAGDLVRYIAGIASGMDTNQDEIANIHLEGSKWGMVNGYLLDLMREKGYANDVDMLLFVFGKIGARLFGNPIMELSDHAWSESSWRQLVETEFSKIVESLPPEQQVSEEYSTSLFKVKLDPHQRLIELPRALSLSSEFVAKPLMQSPQMIEYPRMEEEPDILLQSNKMGILADKEFWKFGIPAIVAVGMGLAIKGYEQYERYTRIPSQNRELPPGRGVGHYLGELFHEFSDFLSEHSLSAHQRNLRRGSYYVGRFPRATAAPKYPKPHRNHLKPLINIDLSGTLEILAYKSIKFVSDPVTGALELFGRTKEYAKRVIQPKIERKMSADNEILHNIIVGAVMKGRFKTQNRIRLSTRLVEKFRKDGTLTALVSSGIITPINGQYYITPDKNVISYLTDSLRVKPQLDAVKRRSVTNYSEIYASLTVEIGSYRRIRNGMLLVSKDIIARLKSNDEFNGLIRLGYIQQISGKYYIRVNN